MRILTPKTINRYVEIYPFSKEALLQWSDVIEATRWSDHNELKTVFGSASVLGSHRVVFNINGNHFRLITDIDYKSQLVFVIWFGSHKEYDKLNVKH